MLTGGASRRMGSDKALLVLDGMPLAARVASTLRAGGADPVVAVGGDARRLSSLGLDVIPDGHPGEGPLGGVITALRWAPHDLVVVAACDLPWLAAETVTELIEAAGPAGAVVSVDGVAQWHLLVLPVAAVEELEGAFERGTRSLREAVGALGPVLVSASRPGELRDVDEPADLGDPSG